MHHADDDWAVFWCSLLAPILLEEVQPGERTRFLQNLSQQEVTLPNGRRKRISLSIRALESNPWSDIKDRFPEGTVLTGKVQKTTKHGALVELEPGLTGLLPASAMSLPRDASIARAFPPGRELTLQIVAVDDRRHSPSARSSPRS